MALGPFLAACIGHRDAFVVRSAINAVCCLWERVRDLASLDLLTKENKQKQETKDDSSTEAKAPSQVKSGAASFLSTDFAIPLASALTRKVDAHLIESIATTLSVVVACNPNAAFRLLHAKDPRLLASCLIPQLRNVFNRVARVATCATIEALVQSARDVDVLLAVDGLLPALLKPHAFPEDRTAHTIFALVKSGEERHQWSLTRSAFRVTSLLPC